MYSNSSKTSKAPITSRKYWKRIPMDDYLEFLHRMRKRAKQAYEEGRTQKDTKNLADVNLECDLLYGDAAARPVPHIIITPPSPKKIIWCERRFIGRKIKFTN